jgi:hypothetical protein
MCNCNRTLSFVSGLHDVYYKCDKKPFKQVQYKSAVSSETITEWLCKTHYNALVKNLNRITLKTKFNFELKTI